MFLLFILDAMGFNFPLDVHRALSISSSTSDTPQHYQQNQQPSLPQHEVTSQNYNADLLDEIAAGFANHNTQPVPPQPRFSFLPPTPISSSSSSSNANSVDYPINDDQCAVAFPPHPPSSHTSTNSRPSPCNEVFEQLNRLTDTSNCSPMQQQAPHNFEPYSHQQQQMGISAVTSHERLLPPTSFMPYLLDSMIPQNHLNAGWLRGMSAENPFLHYSTNNNSPSCDDNSTFVSPTQCQQNSFPFPY
jgi:hypothetical protein